MEERSCGNDLGTGAPSRSPTTRETFGIEEVDNKEHVQDFCGGQPTRKRIRAYEDHEVEKILANSMWGKTGMPSEEINEPIIEPSLSFIAAGKTISYKVLTIAAGVRTLKLQEFDVNESNAENDCYLQDLPVAIACKRGCWNLKENEYEMRQRQRKKIGFLSTKKLRVGICQ